MFRCLVTWLVKPLYKDIKTNGNTIAASRMWLLKMNKYTGRNGLSAGNRVSCVRTPVSVGSDSYEDAESKRIINRIPCATDPAERMPARRHVPPLRFVL